jgi:hypothetical protein
VEPVDRGTIGGSPKTKLCADGFASDPLQNFSVDEMFKKFTFAIWKHIFAFASVNLPST